MNTNTLAADYATGVVEPARLAADAACDTLLGLLRTAIAAAPLTVRGEVRWPLVPRGAVVRRHLSQVQLVHVYRSNGEWCYSAWLADGSYDSSDTLGCADDASTDDAVLEASAQFPDATVIKVRDITTSEGRA